MCIDNRVGFGNGFAFLGGFGWLDSLQYQVNRVESCYTIATSTCTLNELLQRADLKGQFDYSSMIQQLVPRLRRKSVVVILSDFMDPLESLESSLNQLLFEGHQLILLQVLDAGRS